ncbi:MAG: CehA/McbA family metallohydrolase [Candidatus Hydrogenedentes bacterium]|nr:CehA/McbA family metallohydrolase [Candidatus Hydrogenedentota bacterium]
MTRSTAVFWGAILSFSICLAASAQEFYSVPGVEPQPLLAHALRLEEALAFLGSHVTDVDKTRLEALRAEAHSEELSNTIQEILDPYCLALVHINPEMRVKVHRGPAAAELMQGGWSTFLIKVHNESGTRAPLGVESPNAAPLLHRSTGSAEPKPENAISPGDVDWRFLEMKLYQRRPLTSQLSGLPLEYAVLQIYTKDAGDREAQIGFNVGQGTQDLGYRDQVDILFQCKPAVKVVFRVKDHDGQPAMASFVITDNIDRVNPDPEETDAPKPDYRLKASESVPPGAMLTTTQQFTGVYPLPSRRLAEEDEYPDFYFQPQIYRADGEHVYLPPGEYRVEYTRGPEYLPQMKTIAVPEGVSECEASFELKRWIHLAALGWYSADHHVHGGGCSHYESPQAGVDPAAMMRQTLGEDLNIACVLSWGPCWYHQKTFFDGKVNALSTPTNLMRYDVEVSGFPSSHAGHLCLLRLTEDDYPNTTKIEEWPSWTLPVLQWGQSQGAVVGYSHSGWGLEPIEKTYDLPNYAMAKFDGIGANEYIVAVTQNAADFISAGDTPYPWELNIWYHTLNCGFRTRISGETDFPCIYDERVGLARSYAKMDGALDFDAYVERIKEGANYVSDGKSHILDFRVENAEMGVNGSELSLAAPQPVRVSARVAAYLAEEQDETGKTLASLPPDESPYWQIERARIGSTRTVPVELIVNGLPVARHEIVADGSLQDVTFTHSVERSSWMAIRILPSSHTNPVFVLVDGKPVRASKRSAEWCRAAVDRCWEMKRKAIRPEEQPAAQAAYDVARGMYDRVLAESLID